MKIRSLGLLFLLALACASAAQAATSAYIRVSQAGYEAGQSPFRAYLMATAEVSGSFNVVNAKGTPVYTSTVGAQIGTWSNSAKLTYYVYALDFSVPAGLYTLTFSGKPKATSPQFAVDEPKALYSGLLLNSLFFYETERDGKDFIPNALRTAAGHERDNYAHVYLTPPLDENDNIDNKPPAAPLVSAKIPNIDASGGWWDAGDYLKYVETVSYSAALMQIGVRDFPYQMGAHAPKNPPAPAGSVSYAGNSGAGAPKSTNFTAEARFGAQWLEKMWDDSTKTLYYQVDNSQEWNYYGSGSTDATTSVGCGGSYSGVNSNYCLFNEYDIWALPQAADHYEQEGDPEACDPFTSYYICKRPVFEAGAAGAAISPNLAGRLAADFALCYQLNRKSDPGLANRCIKSAEDIFALAKTTYTDPAPSGSGSCSECLLTILPFDGYPETVWEDDMELGATELYFALASAGGSQNLPAGLPDTNPLDYLKLAAKYAKNYDTNIYTPGYADALNLYDVSGLAHYELYKALKQAGDPSGLAVTEESIKAQLLQQVDDAVTQAGKDAWGFGSGWNCCDTASHGAGLSVMASEAYAISGEASYNLYAQRWLGNILGANAWGSSFIVGDGSTFPNCIQHQVANLAGSLAGTSGKTPVLWGAVVEGPASYASSGDMDGMNRCPANGVDTFAKFNGNNGSYNASQKAVYKDDASSYSTTEPAIDLTSSSFLMWAWRLAQ